MSDPDPPDSPEDNGDDVLFIVAVGASAGGLEALSTLLRNVSLERMAFVVVQHLSPTHESALPTVLGRATSVQVVAAADGMKVEANHVYVIPPNFDLAVLHGVLHLMPPGPGLRLSIDYFMRSLAEDQGPLAIGVILSGTGSDGTFGMKAIKDAGGITFAQDPGSARYESMPQSAISAGIVDLILTPEAIGQELAEIGRHPYVPSARARRPSLEVQAAISKLMLLMRSVSGVDLSYYKPTTIERRIDRRMALNKIQRIEDYLRFAQEKPDELHTLYRDILIGVTHFFRDPEAWDALRTQVLPNLGAKPLGAPIRVWVPACSTGEEAYSVAMTLVEAFGDRINELRVQIFGTDVDEAAVQYARRGVYPQNIALDVSPERLLRFFVNKDGHFQVSRRIRDMVVFSSQDITKDAPFSRLDLVTCRNLLIYLQPTMQKKVLRVLHYALNPGGSLLLGTSETVGEPLEHFSLVDRKNKLYVKRAGVSAAPIAVVSHSGTSAIPAATTLDRPPSLAALAEKKILEMYAPPGVVINEQLEILHFRGRTGAYLEAMPGAPTFHVLRQARPELHPDLRRAIDEAMHQNVSVKVPTHIARDGQPRPLTIEVVPVLDPESRRRCFMVLFHEATAERGLTEPPSSSVSPESERNAELSRELSVTKDYLQSTIEELESSNEELKSSNEELQSSNEQLQSTNEELETSKEELQSANEELTTVNDELQDRMGELQLSNDDLYNVLAGMGNAVVIVGLDLRMRRYTHAAEELLNLVATDIGRSVAQLNAFVVGKRVEELAARVVERLLPLEEEVLCVDKRWYALNIAPYRTLDHAIKGAVISLIDIDARRRTADLAGYAEKVFTVVQQPLMITDAALRILWVSRPFLEAYGLDQGAVIGCRIGDPPFVDDTYVRTLQGVASSGTGVAGVVIDGPRRNDGRKTRINAARLPAPGDGTALLISFDADG